jgi:hypothetical protein
MARSCRFTLGSRSGAAQWSFDESSLVVAPEGGSPLAYPVREIIGIAGDGYMLRLTIPGAAAGGDELTLSRLGAEGPTLLDSLRRHWLVARPEALRLSGSGEGRPFSGRVAGPDGSAPEAFQGMLFEDVLLVAREGRDVEPLFLALAEAVDFDEATYAVWVREWPGRELVFSKLAGKTEEFLARLRANRSLLAEESAAVLAASVPTLPAGPRGVLAGTWLPGRLMSLESMSALCPGFEETFRSGWLARLPRRGEGEHLLNWASPGSSWLGCSRETAAGGEGPAATDEEPVDTGAPADAPAPPAAPASPKAAVPPAAAEEGGRLLWMLSGKGGVWFLEALSSGDRATYCFAGGEEMPALVSRLLCAPQFSREALYGPLDTLTGERAELAIAAQFLDFLVRLRGCFRGRVIHRRVEGWQAEMDALGGTSPGTGGIPTQPAS